MSDKTTPRLNWYQLAPKPFQGLLNAEAGLANSSLDKKLLELVKLRVSQINGCAYCADMHARDLLKHGEDLQRLNSLSTWHEVSFFDERECAALRWAECLTRIATGHVPDEEFELLRPHFDDREIAELSVSVALINAWNRMGVGMRMPVVPKPLQPT